jgi:hypothetical protein
MGFLFSLTRQFENIYAQRLGLACVGEPSSCCGAGHKGIVLMLLN